VCDRPVRPESVGAIRALVAWVADCSAFPNLDVRQRTDEPYHHWYRSNPKLTPICPQKFSPGTTKNDTTATELFTSLELDKGGKS
jgi:hypothetical protein